LESGLAAKSSRRRKSVRRALSRRGRAASQKGGAQEVTGPSEIGFIELSACKDQGGVGFGDKLPGGLGHLGEEGLEIFSEPSFGIDQSQAFMPVTGGSALGGMSRARPGQSLRCQDRWGA
jgi:hypothetical protein